LRLRVVGGALASGDMIGNVNINAYKEPIGD
jgi:hypothetical protein